MPSKSPSNHVLSELLGTGVVAVIRLPDGRALPQVVEALRAGGVRFLEVTLTMSDAVSHIRSTAASAPDDVFVGAGTVTTAADAEDVINAGAQFVVSPMLDIRIIETCLRRDVVVVPGCFSPTEIVAGRAAGAQLIKVFPAGVLGPQYFKALRGPFPDARLMPTGGVTIDNVGNWIKAGAAAVAIGSDLLDPSAIAEKKFDVIAERARTMTRNVRTAREALGK